MIEVYLVRSAFENDDLGLDRNLNSVPFYPGDMLIFKEGDRMSRFQCLSIEVGKAMFVKYDELDVPSAERST
jgi:hypothetical protein